MIKRLMLAVVLATGLPKAALSDDLRAEVVQQLQKTGSNVARPHQFDFYLYVPSEANAQAAAQRLRQRGLVVRVRQAEKDSNWLCFASLRAVPDTPKLTELGQLFESLARTYGGSFDGWEAQVVK